MGQEKQAGIQIARAVAALSIVYLHSWVVLTRFPVDTAFPIPVLRTYGWLGVDLFFAISGYVICLVASRETFRVGSFLIKRGLRLYPLWLLTLTTFAATAWLWRGLQPRETLGFYLYSATLLPTEHFPFYDIGWSLQHEMMFYLIAAAVVPSFGLWGLAAVLAVSAFAFKTIDMPWYLAVLANHHGEFLAGVAAFILRDRMARFGSWLPLAVGVAMLGYFAANLYTGWLPVALFLLIVAFANPNMGLQSRSGALAAKLGDASYSLYLIHPLVFLFASAAVSRFPNLPIWTEEPIRFLAIFISIVVSLLSWRYFERPLIKFANTMTSSRRLDQPDRMVSDEARLHDRVGMSRAE